MFWLIIMIHHSFINFHGTFCFQVACNFLKNYFIILWSYYSSAFKRIYRQHTVRITVKCRNYFHSCFFYLASVLRIVVCSMDRIDKSTYHNCLKSYSGLNISRLSHKNVTIDCTTSLQSYTRVYTKWIFFRKLQLLISL